MIKPREILFRVWDGKKFQSSTRFLIESDDGSVWQNEGECEDMLCQKEYILQQFTGLLDQNNKKIYEGDILKVKSYDGWSDTKGFYYYPIVFYDENIAAFVYAPRPELKCGTSFLHPRGPFKTNYEVIGNIFENKDLINKSNTEE